MTGIHGRLPSYGGFLHRGLPLAFVNPWDRSLHASALSPEQAGSHGQNNVITQVLSSGGGPDELLARSLAAGARDNVTAVIVTAT